MAGLYSHRYFYHHIDCDRYKEAYLQYFRGTKDIIYNQLVKFSNELDSAVESFSIDNTPSLSEISYEINQHIRSHKYVESATQRLYEKLKAAFLIRLLYRISKCKRDIEKAAGSFDKYSNHLSVNSTKYIHVSDSLFQALRTEIVNIKNLLSNYKRLILSEDFTHNFLEPITNDVSMYFHTFDLNQPTFTEKAKDAALDGIMKIIGFILLCFVFWLISSIMCK